MVENLTSIHNHIELRSSSGYFALEFRFTFNGLCGSIFGHSCHADYGRKYFFRVVELKAVAAAYTACMLRRAIFDYFIRCTDYLLYLVPVWKIEFA